MLLESHRFGDGCVERDLEELIEKAARLLASAQRIVVLTGAGVSTDSSVSAFRSSSDLATFTSDEFSFPQFIGDPASRRKAWQTWNMFRMIDQAQPNPAHHALSEIEKMGKLDCIITQNVDGLHQKAGVPAEKIIELHGSLRRLKCLNCGRIYDIIEVARRLGEGEEQPTCSECGENLKAATVSFGEAPPAKETGEAEQHSRNCDLFMLLGSSLMVYPAAYMPIYALESGAKLIIITVGAGSMDEQADVHINDTVGEVLPRIVERARSIIAGE